MRDELSIIGFPRTYRQSIGCSVHVNEKSYSLTSSS